MSDDLVKRLREYTSLRYSGDCKCGKCQLVPRDTIDEAATRIEELEAEHRIIRDNIPMEYLQANDTPGATGPTNNLNLGQAVRDFSAARWRLINRVMELETKFTAALQPKDN